MRLLKSRRTWAVWVFSLLLICWARTWAQAASAVQFFFPGGELPSRPLRFTLISPSGSRETLLTDAKGKFSITVDQAGGGEFSLIAEGDKLKFETTNLRFRLQRGTPVYLPIFLRPMKSDAPVKAPTDVAKFDANAPAEVRAAFEQAVKFVGQNKPDEAINEFTRALVAYPQHVRALNELGALFANLNRLDEAAAAFTQAVSLNARFQTPLLNLALVRNRQGYHAEAVALFDRLLKEYAVPSAARVVYAESLGATQQWDEAELQLREALKDAGMKTKDRANAHLRLGLKLSRDERYQSAAAEMEKAVALDPGSAHARLSFGAALAQLKKSEDAERELLKAYELGGKVVASAQLLLGQLYYDQQKYEPALRAFEQFLTDQPNSSAAAQVRQTIDRIKELMGK
jgi:tetratricopeptide (TPR) repeat protein